MLVAVLIALGLLLALAAWRLVWTTRANTAALPASLRVHAALTEVTLARAEVDRIAARLAAAVATADPGQPAGFGDAHVRRARLRAALAERAGEPL